MSAAIEVFAAAYGECGCGQLVISESAYALCGCDQPLELQKVGWFWWACFPGCLPDSEAFGPFDSEQEAIADADTDADANAEQDDDDSTVICDSCGTVITGPVVSAPWLGPQAVICQPCGVAADQYANRHLTKDEIYLHGYVPCDDCQRSYGPHYKGCRCHD